MKNNINGIDVATNNNIYYSQKAVDKLLNDIKRLQKENEELKARLKTLDDEVLTIEITPDEFERYKKSKQALEEIKIAIRQKLQEHKDVREFINPPIEDGKAFVFQEGYIAALESVIGLIERFEE